MQDQSCLCLKRSITPQPQTPAPPASRRKATRFYLEVIWKEHMKSCSSDSVSITFRRHLQIFSSWACLWFLVQSIYCILQLLGDGGFYTGTGRRTHTSEKWVPWSANLTNWRICLWEDYPWDTLRAAAVHFQVMLAVLAKPAWGGWFSNWSLDWNYLEGLLNHRLLSSTLSFCFCGNVRSNKLPGDINAAGPGITLFSFFFLQQEFPYIVLFIYF